VAYPLNAVYDRLTTLAACLCTQIETDGLPGVCFCGIVPGDAAAAFYSGDCTKKCGMAWVRLDGMQPASGVGIPNEQPGNCASGLGFAVEVGIMRCTPIGEMDRPPTAAELAAATELQVADAATMRRAVACCAGSDDWVLGTYASLGPQGGMLTGAWTVTMWVP
jgi:hypothetical protein